MLLLGAAVGSIAALRVFWLLAERTARKTNASFDGVLIRKLRSPLSAAIPLFCVRAVIPLTDFKPNIRGTLEHALHVLLIGACAWLVLRALQIAEVVLAKKLSIDAADNLRARRVQTQVRGLRNILSFLIGLLALAFMLMTFSAVRELGVSLLASAGVAGIVVGFAAQKSIATLLAGIQVAIAQPIRVDDVVVVEGEWGRIEEITLTYVVIRLWDLRRLVVPIQYFLENPFQNWTRSSAEIIGTVFLHIDYRAPIDRIREELERVAGASKLWDRKVCVLQVTATNSQSVELRALVSAADSAAAWDLRCEVREHLLAFLQRECPDSLPRVRAELKQPETAA